MLKLILTMLPHSPPADRHSEKWFSSCQSQMILKIITLWFFPPSAYNRMWAIKSTRGSITVFWVMTMKGSQNVAVRQQHKWAKVYSRLEEHPSSLGGLEGSCQETNLGWYSSLCQKRVEPELPSSDPAPAVWQKQCHRPPSTKGEAGQWKGWCTTCFQKIRGCRMRGRGNRKGLFSFSYLK